MSYLVLARKWRPQNFEQVIGQQTVVRILRNALKHDRVAHAMLFSGVRGVGKTTLARIMAKAMNCRSENRDDRPCNRCEACREITNGSAVDLHEIDGASNRGIQEIRELKENIRFFPTKNRYKVIIIDEVHMLTTEAFNALLKTLEEPPAHVFFMFATTELHKIPITILSRCQRYELKRVPFAELRNFFREIADRENVKISERALGIISREADGSVRDGLSLLDQMFSFGGSEVRDEDIVQVLGLVDHGVFSRLARGLLAGDLALSLELLEQTYRAGIDLKRFANDLLLYFRTLLICKTSEKPEEMLDISDVELAEAREIAGSGSAETLYQYFHFLLKAGAEMRYSNHPRLVLEMAFIKAAQRGEIVPAQTLLTRLDELLSQGGITLPAGAAAVPPPASPPAPGAAPSGQARPFVPAEKAPETETLPVRETGEEEKRSVGDIASGPPPEKHKPPEKVPEPESIKRPEPVAAGGQTRDVRLHWDQFTAYVKDRKTWMAHTLQICDKVEEKDHELILKFIQENDCTMLRQDDNLKALARFAQDFFQKEFKVKVMIRGGDTDGNANNDDTISAERRALANDHLVRTASEIFGGRVVSVRTGPRFR